MIREFKYKLIFKIVVFCVLLVGALIRLGIFTGGPHPDSWLYYTNLSNYICFILIIMDLIFTIKDKLNNEVKNRNTFNIVKLLAGIWILITCAVYNILLGDFFSVDYWTAPSNLSFHLFGPILFILDLFLCTPKIKLTYKLIPTVVTFPYVYLTFILIRSVVIDRQPDDMIYPYFFLNVDNLGWGGVFMWIGILSVVFIGLAFIFMYLKKDKTLKA